MILKETTICLTLRSRTAGHIKKEQKQVNHSLYGVEPIVINTEKDILSDITLITQSINARINLGLDIFFLLPSFHNPFYFCTQRFK